MDVIMERSMRENTGNLNISQEVLATIAKHVACEVPGVAGMAVAPTRIRTLKKLLFPASSPAKSVDIEISDDMATVDVYVTLEYGANIPAVSENIQKNIKDSIQTMTSIVVSKVNVHIAGIVFPEEKEGKK